MRDRLGTLGQQMGQLSDEEFYRQFLADQGWPQETEEDRLLDEKFCEELEEDVKREEALLAAHPEITETEASPDLFDRIMKQAEKMDNGKETKAPEQQEPLTGNYHPENFLSEEDRKALEIGRKHIKNRKRHRWIGRLAANAAVLACVFFVGVSTEANRTRIVNVINTWIGNEALGRVNNETDREHVGSEQEKACADIEEQLGIKPVRFMYAVEGLEFGGYEIDLVAKGATMFYSYTDSFLTIIMRKDEDGAARGSIKDGIIQNTFTVQTDIGNIEIAEIEGSIGEKYMAEFIYNNTYYHIFCELPKEEFENLIASIFF